MDHRTYCTFIPSNGYELQIFVESLGKNYYRCSLFIDVTGVFILYSYFVFVCLLLF